MTEKSIVRVCKKCGPLYDEDIRIRKRPNCIERICLKCESRRAREQREKNHEKYLEKSRINRNFVRDPDTKEMRCSKCQTVKCVSLFNLHMLRIKYPYCKECRIDATKNYRSKEESKKKHKQWYHNNYAPIARNKSYLKAYGITLEQYELMLSSQNNCCHICQIPEDPEIRARNRAHFHVDHCHATGKVRGILCPQCNQGLGGFRDNISSLERAIEYLKIHL